MATPSRTSRFNKLFKVLKKHYKPVVPDLERTVLDQLLFASCLENAHTNVAEEAFAALAHNFFDWNEVRVSTVRELAEEMSCLPEPASAGDRVKRILQSVFEDTYEFDLEELRKLNLGPAIEKLSKIDGTTAFTVAYVVRMSLGGHTIPIDSGTLRALWVVDLVSDAHVEAKTVPGLERAVAKNKGIEYGSLLHQLGADMVATPFATSLRTLLKEIHPDCDERLPRRRSRKSKSTPDDTTRGKKKSGRQPDKSQTAETPAVKSGSKKETPKKKKSSRRKSEPDTATASSKEPAKEKGVKPVEKKKKTRESKSKTTSGKKKSNPPLDKSAESKKDSVSGLSKRKPR